MAINAILYAEDTWDIADPTQSQIQTMQNAANEIRTSGFTTIILSFLHVDSSGGLVYNGTAIDELYSQLPQMWQGMKTGGTVSTLLFSIGGGGGVACSDYTNIQNNLSTFQSNLASFMSTYGIDGIDFDLEADGCTYEQYSGLLVSLTQWLHGMSKMVTAPPYQESSFWLDLLEQTAIPAGSPPPEISNMFSLWDLQIYGGANYDGWVKQLQADASKTGIEADAVPMFLFPGYSTGDYGSSDPADLQMTLTGLQKTYKNIGGAMLWKYEQMAAGSIDAWASAILNGLG